MRARRSCGFLGVLAARGMEVALQRALSARFPGFEVGIETVLTGLAIAIGIGLFAGLAPGLRASRMTPLQALREEG